MTQGFPFISSPINKPQIERSFQQGERRRRRKRSTGVELKTTTKKTLLAPAVDATLHHFCHYITVPSLHNLSALHQRRPWVRLTFSFCGGDERHKQTVNGGGPFHVFFQRRKTSINGMDFFTCREADLMLQRQNTMAAAYFFNFPLSSLTVAASRQFLFRFLRMKLSFPPKPPPSASLSAASSKLERCWRVSSQCECVLNSTRGEKPTCLLLSASLSMLCLSTLRIITAGYLC